MMTSDIASRLRRDADYLLQLHEREHPGQRTSAPWYVETMREAAERIEMQQALLDHTAQELKKPHPIPWELLEEMDGKPVFVVTEWDPAGKWYINCDTLRIILGGYGETCAAYQNEVVASGSDLCACCGAPVPEGRQVCWRCERENEREGMSHEQV